MKMPPAGRWGEIYEIGGSAGRIRSMEGIRGLAVLLVFWVHFDALFGRLLAGHPWWQGVSALAGSAGDAGVDLFFVLSGYLIYARVLDKPAGVGRFLRRRAQRIYPAFLCVLALYTVAALAGATNRLPRGAAGALYLLENAALLPGLFRIQPLVTVAWSLSYEAFFYGAIPLLVVATGMRRWNGRSRCLFFVLLGCVYAALNLSFPEYTIGWLALQPAAHPRLLLFVAGMLVYEAHRRGPRTAGWGGGLAGAAGLAGGLAIYTLLHENRWLALHLRTGLSGALALALGFSVFVYFCCRAEGWLAAAFCFTPLRRLGNMSYSFYLTHGVALFALRALLNQWASPAWESGAAWLLLLPAGLLLSLAASTVLFVLVERPFSLSGVRVPVGRSAADAQQATRREALEPK